jgi:hypothetical protein
MATGRALFRLARGRRLLQWTPTSDSANAGVSSVVGYVRSMWFSWTLAVVLTALEAGAAPGRSVLGTLLFVGWFCAPVLRRRSDGRLRTRRWP